MPRENVGRAILELLEAKCKIHEWDEERCARCREYLYICSTQVLKRLGGEKPKSQVLNVQKRAASMVGINMGQKMAIISHGLIQHINRPFPISHIVISHAMPNVVSSSKSNPSQFPRQSSFSIPAVQLPSMLMSPPSRGRPIPLSLNISLLNMIPRSRRRPRRFRRGQFALPFQFFHALAAAGANVLAESDQVGDVVLYISISIWDTIVEGVEFGARLTYCKYAIM